MTAQAIVALAVSVIGGLLIVGRLLWSLHKLVSLGEHIVVRVEMLEKQLSNGISAKITSADERAKEASQLAAIAAASVARVEQLAENNGRAMNALRSEVDIYTDLVRHDQSRTRRALRDLGYPIDEIDDAD